ncbi:unnamed protein product, partial [Musa acuminata var. zebrina]
GKEECTLESATKQGPFCISLMRSKIFIQRATQNFTTVLGQQSFGPLYQATIPTGELVAVKALAGNSIQGKK